MADINITITVPDASVAVVKASIEHFALTHGDLEAGQTYTGAQLLNYTKQLLINRLRELVKVYKTDTAVSTATAQASSETTALVIN